MDKFLVLTVTGLCTAGVFAIGASGLVLTYTTTGIFNFAHGAIGMLGAFAYWQLLEWGVPTGLAVAIVLLAVAPALGAVIDLGIMRGLETASEMARLVVSVAMLAAALGLGIWLWPPDVGRPLDLFFPDEHVRIAGVNVSWHELLALVLAVVVAVGLRLLLYNSRPGITMRAVVDDRSLALLNGARPDRSSLLAWSIGCSLAALAGILVAAQQGLTHLPLTLLIVNAYAAAMLGRLRSLPLTFLGAVALGLLDAYGVGYLPSDNAYLSGFRPAIPVLVLFLVLLALPSTRLRAGGTRRRIEAPRTEWRSALLLAGVVVLGAAVLAGGLTEVDAGRAARGAALAIIALSLVPLVGWAGQLCLCQMSFAAIGAMVFAHLGEGGNPWALLAGAAVAAVVGVLVALPVLRLSGIELALATAAFAVILDRWVFTLPTFHVGPWSISFFDQASLLIDRLALPGAGTLSNRGLLLVVGVAFALAHLGIVAVRRSRFGDRLIALRDSPAACATLGMDLARTRLAVFAFSAALAAFGGGLYASTFGGVSPDSFGLFASLPLLLLTVAGGVTSSGGAVFAGIILGGIPIVAATWAGLAGLLGVLPGTMGITLGRNPDGVVRDLAQRTRPVLERPSLLLGIAVAEAALVALWLTGTLSGWVAGVVGFLLPFIGARLAELGAAEATAPDPLDDVELLGLDGRASADDVRRLDLALALDEVPA
jgi:branched-chain amino acid transport system permease protein